MNEQIKLLKAREKVIIQELEFSPLRSLENELYDIRDTLKKLQKPIPTSSLFNSTDPRWQTESINE